MADGRHVLGPLVFASVTAFMAAAMFVTAIAVWLYTLIGSVILTCVITGFLLLALSVIVYMVWVHEPVMRVRMQVEEIYGIVRAARSGFEWAFNRLLDKLSDRM